MSGIWVEEGFYECGEYLAEKCYRLYNKSDDNSYERIECYFPKRIP